MLTQNTACRLHKASKESQLLKRLGGEWYPHRTQDTPLPMPNNERARTTLRLLAAQVPAKCPQIQLFPDLPPDALTWDGRVTCHPKQGNQNHGHTIKSIVKACWKGGSVNIFITGTYSNKHQADGKQLGMAVAVLYHEGQDWKHIKKVLRETATEQDAALQAVLLVLELLADFLATHENQTRATIVSPSDSAITRMLDATPHEEQSTSIQCLNKIGKLLTAYPNTTIQLLWLPRVIPFVGF